MAITYDNVVKAARLTATRDAVVGGTLELLSASSQVLAIFELTSAGGSIDDDVWSVAFEDNATVGTAASGEGTTATAARFKNSGGTVRVSGLTVGLSGADIVLNNVSISEGQSVELTASTITHAP